MLTLTNNCSGHLYYDDPAHKMVLPVLTARIFFTSISSSSPPSTVSNGDGRTVGIVYFNILYRDFLNPPLDVVPSFIALALERKPPMCHVNIFTTVLRVFDLNRCRHRHSILQWVTLAFLQSTPNRCRHLFQNVLLNTLILSTMILLQLL